MGTLTSENTSGMCLNKPLSKHAMDFMGKVMRVAVYAIEQDIDKYSLSAPQQYPFCANIHIEFDRNGGHCVLMTSEKPYRSDSWNMSDLKNLTEISSL